MAQYSKNDIVTVKIEDIGTEGEGIGKLEGFTLFVKDAVMGDVVEARLVKVKKNYAYAFCNIGSFSSTPNAQSVLAMIEWVLPA